ncbi:unnamed protein product [Somion occarium]|uniref:Yeast cell wall synthesis Kre9/Knh1-like N-terminal domain-containing protein n=1 Tax=Somion occarium TaxID=3059160 RepID=A0ABP1CRV4_9APHY
MLFATLAPALAFVPAAFAAISITGPSGSAYWVQNTSNVINWTFEQGDPNPASIIVTNSNNTFLNGAFSIAEFLDLSNKTFTVTNVTLRVADGYTVSLVNPQNQSEVFASSSTFSVRAPGSMSSLPSSLFSLCLALLVILQHPRPRLRAASRLRALARAAQHPRALLLAAHPPVTPAPLVEATTAPRCPPSAHRVYLPSLLPAVSHPYQLYCSETLRYPPTIIPLGRFFTTSVPSVSTLGLSTCPPCAASFPPRF